jgi:hypothetical protein
MMMTKSPIWSMATLKKWPANKKGSTIDINCRPCRL